MFKNYNSMKRLFVLIAVLAIAVTANAQSGFGIKGGLNFLINNNNYYVKMEFAPFWFESQKTNPKLFLVFLINITHRFMDIKHPNKNKLNASEWDSFNPKIHPFKFVVVDIIKKYDYPQLGD